MNYIERKEKYFKVIDSDAKKKINKLPNSEIKDRFSALNLSSSTTSKFEEGTNRFNKFTLKKISYCIIKYLNYLKIDTILLCSDYNDLSKEVKKELISYLSRKLKIITFNNSYPTSFFSYSIRHEMIPFSIMISKESEEDNYLTLTFYDKYGKEYLNDDIKDIILLYSSLDNYFDININYAASAKIKYLDNERNYLIDYFVKEAAVSICNNFLKGDKKVNLILVSNNQNQLDLFKEAMSYNNYFTLTYLNNEFNLTTIIYTLKQRKINFLIVYLDNSSNIKNILYLNNLGEIKSIDGNIFSSLLFDFYVSNLNKRNLLQNNPLVILSNKVNNQFVNIVEEYGIEYKTTLNDFKYISNIIYKEKENSKNVLMALLNNYSFLFADFVMINDPFQTLLSILDFTECTIRSGRTIDYILNEINRKYGKYIYHQETLTTAIDPNFLLDELRNINSSLSSIKIKEIIDYYNDSCKDLKTHYTSILDEKDIVKNNSLKFMIEDDGYILFSVNKFSKFEIIINYKINKNTTNETLSSILLEIKSILKLP